MIRAIIIWNILLIGLVGCAVQTQSTTEINKTRAENVSKALKIMSQLDSPQKEEISEMLLNEKYVELEQLSKRFEKMFEANPLHEWPMMKFYFSMDGTQPSLLSKLDKWVKTRPSYISYTARGAYKTKRGYTVRGAKYIKDTPQFKIEKMKIFHRQATVDLYQALTYNNQYAPAYHQLLSIMKSSASKQQKAELYERAIGLVPESYYLRHKYISTLHPRWGGSYNEMLLFLSTIEKDLPINPRIWALKAEIPGERGFTAYQNKNYDNSIAYYTEALSYGDRMGFLRMRGKAYMKKRQYDSAMKDFRKFQEYKTNNREVNKYIKQINEYLSLTRN